MMVMPTAVAQGHHKGRQRQLSPSQTPAGRPSGIAAQEQGRRQPVKATNLQSAVTGPTP